MNDKQMMKFVLELKYVIELAYSEERYGYPAGGVWDAYLIGSIITYKVTDTDPNSAVRQLNNRSRVRGVPVRYFNTF